MSQKLFLRHPLDLGDCRVVDVFKTDLTETFTDRLFERRARKGMTHELADRRMHNRDWFAAMMLRGKHKPMFSTNIDCGDHIVVINAEKVLMTGRKRDQKTYYWHTGYPGGIRSRTPAEIFAGPTPEHVVSLAIQRMIPKGPLGRKQLSNLKVYAGSEHPHEAQQPEILDVAAMNRKNKRSAIRG